MNEIKFHSLNELYKRLLPALKSKKKTLHQKGYTYIYEEDIWNCCKTSWSKRTNLELYNMVDDILNTDDEVFDKYLKEYFKGSHRRLSKDEIHSEN
ncbi:MAG: hypothetical protein IJO33_05500 [Bacilli bacterium]|nr:hypothetical protein [Bacilli bacterium]